MPEAVNCSVTVGEIVENPAEISTFVEKNLQDREQYAIIYFHF